MTGKLIVDYKPGLLTLTAVLGKLMLNGVFVMTLSTLLSLQNAVSTILAGPIFSRVSFESMFRTS